MFIWLMLNCHINNGCMAGLNSCPRIKVLKQRKKKNIEETKNKNRITEIDIDIIEIWFNILLVWVFLMVTLKWCFYFMCLIKYWHSRVWESRRYYFYRWGISSNVDSWSYQDFFIYLMHISGRFKVDFNLIWKCMEHLSVSG